MKKYELYGFLNMFDIVPDFVYPVFQSEDEFFFQEGENDKIENFVLVKESIYPLIHEINEFKKNKKIANKFLTIDSRPLYAFQIEKNDVICGNAEMILHFFDNYEVSNNYLKEEIEELKKELYHSKSTRYFNNCNTKERNFLSVMSKKIKFSENLYFLLDEFTMVFILIFTIFKSKEEALQYKIIIVILYIMLRGSVQFRKLIEEKCEDLKVYLELMSKSILKSIKKEDFYDE